MTKLSCNREGDHADEGHADEPAFETARRLAVEEGLFVGMSSGAAVAGAIEASRRIGSGTIAITKGNLARQWMRDLLGPTMGSSTVGGET